MRSNKEDQYEGYLFVVIWACEDEVKITKVKAVNGISAVRQFVADKGVNEEEVFFVVRRADLQKVRAMPPESPRWTIVTERF